MKYDWLWTWGDGPAQSYCGGERYKTASQALWHGKRARAAMIKADKEHAAKDTTGYWARFVRPLGTVEAVETEPEPYNYILDY